MRGESRLGLLDLREVDQPFFHCFFAPDAAFATYEKLFESEALALSGGGAEYESLVLQIEELDLRLVGNESGETIEAPLIHINRHDAWFRY